MLHLNRIHFLCLIFLLIFFGTAHAADKATIINGNISVTGSNTGEIISIGGGKMGGSALWGLASIEGSVGNVNDTETNINSVLIGSGTQVTGNITLNATNTGSIKNLGSKVNVNSILIGK